jgi:hypothetical protein
MSKRFEGYHDLEDLPVKRGDHVTVLKGTRIKTTMPAKDGSGYRVKVAGRTYKVTVHHVLNGVTRSDLVCGRGETPGPVSPPQVCWAGEGGYWHQVDLNDVPEAQ